MVGLGGFYVVVGVVESGVRWSFVRFGVSSEGRWGFGGFSVVDSGGGGYVSGQFLWMFFKQNQFGDVYQVTDLKVVQMVLGGADGARWCRWCPVAPMVPELGVELSSCF
ncbi:hypothetical protein Hdeb2414_s0004g00144811 [Helianthus debilis subsp. tardiflorus]